MQERMQLHRGDTRRPHQRATIVDQDIINLRPALVARHWKSLHPFWSKTGSILFVERFAVDTVRIPLQRYGSVPKVRQ